MFLLVGCSNSNPEYSQAQEIKNQRSSGFITIENNNVDLKEIPILGGKIETTFNFKNEGNEKVALLEGATSCGCTEAFVRSNDDIESSRIRMRGGSVYQVLESNEEATLVAIFDPLAHGEDATGLIKRDIIIKTNSSRTPQIIFSFQGNVIRGSETPVKKSVNENVSEYLTTFAFKEESYDFGKIKQSGGKVEHEFAFIYNGEESIKITGVPTSCACTSAKVEPTNFNQGDEGILTVTFNPNLHEEPEGRFFKTVSLLTEPKLEEMPEVKIWTEIDFDLGAEAYELQSDHEEEEEHGEPQYNSITPEVFHSMLENKDFVLIDTHIPEQTHIESTDFFIPYDEISHASNLPKDKNAKIVLYCRSGSMSRAAAYQLAEEGYTNIYDLVGGKNAYDVFLNQ